MSDFRTASYELMLILGLTSFVYKLTDYLTDKSRGPDPS